MGRVVIATHEAGLLDELTAIVRAMGHDVLPARTGAEAWGVIESHRPDAVLAEAELPGRSGPELLDAAPRRRSPTSP
jgi:DNA-binding response OmpR family regulator